MMRRWLVLLFLPMSAVAEPVTLRTGEHDTFTRFVIAIGEGTSWSVNEVEDGVVLELENRADGFALSEAFERIPRDRVASLQQLSSDQLLFEVVCACHVDPFLWRSDQLVIDIVDGPDPNTPAEPVLAGLDAPIIAVTNANETRASLPNLLAPYLASPLPLDLPAGPLNESRTVPSEDLSVAQTALIEELARAASQGILNVIEREHEETAEPESVFAPPPEEPLQRILSPGVDITNARDFDLNGNRHIALPNDSQCLSGDLFSFADWGNDRPFHSQYAALADALLGDFGEPTLEATVDVARLYLHFGFGAEARAILSSDESRSTATSVLMELAAVIDDDEGPTPLILNQSRCETPGAMWSFLVSPVTVEDDERQRILQDFFALPEPLRSHIAPRLAQGFLSVGDSDAADRLVRAIRKNDAGLLHDTVMTEIDIVGERDRQAAAEILNQQVQTNPRTSPESMVRFLEARLAAGLEIAEADLILAAAFRQEYRETSMETPLAVVEARGHIQRQDYRTAADLLSDSNDLSALEARDDLYRHLADRAGDEQFLIFAFESLPEGISAATENELSRRLIMLGFPERALDLLEGPSERAAAAERRYLKAEAAIAMNAFEAAQDALLGMTDERARRLRSQALAGMGEYDEALSALPVDDEQNSTLQYRSGAWERLATEGDEVLADFARALLSDPASTTPTTLADRRTVLDRAEESRRTVEALLQRFDGDLSADGQP